jgi:hypothetical protein
MTTTRPRSKAAKTTESAIDAGWVTTATTFAFALTRSWHKMDPLVEAMGVSVVVPVIVGAVRWVRLRLRERASNV